MILRSVAVVSGTCLLWLALINMGLRVTERPSETLRLQHMRMAQRRLISPQHVVFTTFKSKPGYDAAYNRSLAAMRATNVVSMIITGTRSNEYGYPFLKDLYLEAMSTFPWADTYTYYNADLLFNATALVATLDALVYAARNNTISKRFMGVGFRHEVNVSLTGDFAELFNKSKKFQEDAQDYFVTSPDVWRWQSMPNVVVGRIAYDNYLLQRATTTPGVDAVELSETNPALHLAVNGNFDGFKAKNSADKYYNFHELRRKVGSWDMNAGRMPACRMETYWDHNGAVAVRRRR